jgi:hypothetical protein
MRVREEGKGRERLRARARFPPVLQRIVMQCLPIACVCFTVKVSYFGVFLSVYRPFLISTDLIFVGLFFCLFVFKKIQKVKCTREMPSCKYEVKVTTFVRRTNEYQWENVIKLINTGFYEHFNFVCHYNPNKMKTISYSWT